MSQDLPSSSESINPEPLESSAKPPEPGTEPELDTEIAPESIDPLKQSPEPVAEAPVVESSEPIAPAAPSPTSISEIVPESVDMPEQSPEPVVVVSSEPIAAPIVEPSSEVAPPAAQQTVRRPSRRRAPENDEILPQTLLRLVGEAIVAAQPVLKRQSIKALKGTIQLLERAVERLEAEPTPKRRKVPAPDMASESALPPTSATDTGKLAPPLSTADLQAKFRTLWQQIQRQWSQLLPQIRDRLPESVDRKLSDQALTGAIAGILVVLLWITSALLPDQPKPTTIAETPPAETIAPVAVPTPVPPVVEAPEPSKPIEISPSPSPPPPPPPPLKLTPEQKLIARIQDRVAEISNQYASGLIQSVQANFRSSRLIVNVSNGWYGLGRSQQDKLASEILRRTQELDFTKLELVDETGTLLARSPVVGAEMIILKRTNESAAI